MVEGAQDAHKLKKALKDKKWEDVSPVGTVSVLKRHYDNPEFLTNPKTGDSFYSECLSHAKPEYVVGVCREILAERARHE